MGDFNEISYRGEKVGGGERPEWQMRAFSSVINKSKLRDMGFIGPEFTWSRQLGAMWVGLGKTRPSFGIHKLGFFVSWGKTIQCGHLLFKPQHANS